MSLGADSRGRTCLSSPGQGSLTRLLCGSWTHESGPQGSLHPLLSLLPEILFIPQAIIAARDDLRSILDLLLREQETGDVGSASVSSRLLDILFVTALRAWLDQAEESANWLTALRDPVAGPALRLLHGQPRRDWRLDELARAVGASRSVLARRFTEIVGDPPMTYLGRLRMQEAESLLRGSHASLAEIAGRVGYASEFAFMKAFKRWKGQPPGRWRIGG
jgi:AraC-like DNA-binding protein